MTCGRSIGGRAKSLFTERGIEVVIGALSDTPEQAVADFIAGKLQIGGNLCDH